MDRTGLDLLGWEDRTGLDLLGWEDRTELDLLGWVDRTGLDLLGVDVCGVVMVVRGLLEMVVVLVVLV